MAQFIEEQDRPFLAALSELAYCNPFLPERLELERKALRDDYLPEDSIAWSRAAEAAADRPNVQRLTERAERLVRQLRPRAEKLDSFESDEAGQYRDLVSYVLYYRHVTERSVGNLAGLPKELAKAWRAFDDDFHALLGPAGGALRGPLEPTHLFACLFQLRRAFWHIYDNIIGDSAAAARLRAAVWQSIFTHDMRRYRRSLYNRMGEIATLITGPSGTGKELVARAIGCRSSSRSTRSGSGLSTTAATASSAR